MKIIDAVQLLARARRGESVQEPRYDGGVGERVARFRGADLALGARPYVADLRREGMLHGALTLSAHARAKVLRIDTSRAAAHQGVVAVATYRDVPGDRFYGLIKKDWPGFVAEGEEVRYVGDVVAAVAAVDEHTARAADELVDVEYEVRPAVTSPTVALSPEAPRVNPAYENVLSHTRIRRGDVDAALASSAHVVTGTWSTRARARGQTVGCAIRNIVDRLLFLAIQLLKKNQLYDVSLRQVAPEIFP